MNSDLKAAIDRLTTYGYCLLEDRIPGDLARSMAERFLELHTDPKCEPYNTGDRYYQTLFGMMNLDDRVWICASHPDVVSIAQHFLGPNCRTVKACSKPTWPGAPGQHLHVDSAGQFHEVPDVPWMINTIWMLTDFTEDNGATGVVPLSSVTPQIPAIGHHPRQPANQGYHRTPRLGNNVARWTISSGPCQHE